MTQNINWKNLGFDYIQTPHPIRYQWKAGKWDGGELMDEPFIRLHIAATSLHYGQECFEGLKAFTCRDGKVRIFRPEENAKRLNHSGQRILMPEVPEPLFLEAIKKAVTANKDFIPPFGTGASLYIRPLLFGSGPVLGVNPSLEYTFIVFVTPVGPYYKNGIKPVKALVLPDFDRTAPKGTGNVKVGGNYAASLLPSREGLKKDFPIILYLDAKTRTYIDEFGTSNFMGFTDRGTYVTPNSPTILKSVTNKSLMDIARHLGIQVEERAVSVEELEKFAEVGACGTAALITPVYEIHHGNRVFRFGKEDSPGPLLQKLYNRLIGIQNGTEKDIFNWMVDVF